MLLVCQTRRGDFWIYRWSYAMVICICPAIWLRCLPNILPRLRLIVYPVASLAASSRLLGPAYCRLALPSQLHHSHIAFRPLHPSAANSHAIPQPSVCPSILSYIVGGAGKSDFSRGLQFRMNCRMNCSFNLLSPIQALYPAMYPKIKREQHNNISDVDIGYQFLRT